MTDASENLEDEYQEFDDLEDEEEERGLSGLAVLVMGMVMIAAFGSVVYFAYNQGIKTGRDGAEGVPYVAADPEPIKIENVDDSAPIDDSEVYDVFDGDDAEPVTVLTEGPEEPIERAGEDAIGDLAAAAEAAAEDVADEVNDRLASLEAEDANVLPGSNDVEDEPVTVTPPTTTSVTQPVDNRPTVRVATSGDALAGSHVVQVGAFRSDGEAQNQWSRIQVKMGDYVDGKTIDVERADLGDRGVYHRLRIGPFASADEAKTYCAGLKERGQDCLIKGV